MHTVIGPYNLLFPQYTSHNLPYLTMSGSYVPQNLLYPVDGFFGDAPLSLKLPLRPKTRPEKWDHSKTAVLVDRDNWRKWDALFKVLEDCWTSATTKEAAESAHVATRAAFTLFLHRFPYLVQHWRQFSVVEYKMAGVDESVKCLKNSVAACPQSVALWVEYLSALMTVETAVLPNDKETDGKEVEDGKLAANDTSDTAVPSQGSPVLKSSKSKEQDGSPTRSQSASRNALLRGEFQRAASLVGLNFNSDPFWNKYIEFETSVASNAPLEYLIKLYLRLVRIPLYQYAQYYNQFTEINKNYLVLEIVDETDLLKYLEVFGKGLPAELSVVEQHQLIDTYSYDIFTQTQAHVTRKWPFEAVLTFQEFSPADKKEIQAQTGEWKKYIEAESALLSTLTGETEQTRQYELIASLFERALVPNCTNSDLWLQYVGFVKENSKLTQSPNDVITDIYERAIFTFLPVDCSHIRSDYADYLLTEKGSEFASQFLLKTIRLYSGTTGARVYVKTAYVHDLTKLFQVWNSLADGKQVALALENLVTSYFNHVDRQKREAPGKRDPSSSETTRISSAEIASVAQYLNDDGICVVSVQYLRITGKEKENASKIRQFYNRYHTEAPFARSVQFWKFFIDFEGYEHKHLKNLRNVVNYVKTSTALPKKAIDAFLDIYYELTCANLAQATALSGEENYLDILVNVSAEKSDDLFVNQSARKRLAKFNYLLPEYKNNSHQLREDLLMKLRAKHVTSPGVLIESKPEITNRLMDKGWISLLDDDLLPPELPAFKNLDKANAPIHYPEE